MPRAFRQDKLTILIPVPVLQALQEKSEHDEMPVAEILRQIISLIFLLDLLGPKRLVVPAPPGAGVARFTFFIPWPLMNSLRILGDASGLGVNEVVRRGIAVYFKLVEARSNHHPLPLPANDLQQSVS